MQYTKEQLREILDKHKLWLEDKPGGEKVNLSGADLSEADLSETLLKWADLSSANLSKATLSGADLRGVCLKNANLREANLSRTNLSDADLSETDLSNANFRGADLRGVYLCEANLKNANLYVACADFIKGIDLVVISTGLQHRIVKHGDILYIGCEEHSIAHWLEHYQKIGEDYRYSPEEIEIYGEHIKHLSRLQKGKTHES